MAAPMFNPASRSAARQLRVIEYGRVSTNQQDLERQDFELSDNREQHNLHVVRRVMLKVSGTKVGKNADWLRMIEDMKNPDIDAISISAIDRLFRPKDYAALELAAIQVIADHKKVIISTKEGYLQPWLDRDREIVMAAVQQAGRELAEIKRRTKGGRRKAHAANKPMNTDPSFGILYRDKYSKDAEGKCQYFYEDTEPASNGQPRRAVIEMIFNWRHVEQMKIYAMVDRLNGLGILTAGKRKKDGTWQYAPGLWSAQTVKQVLKNRKYIGEHWEGDHHVECPCPTFISREIFDAVQASFLAEQAEEDRQGRPSLTALLGTFLACDRCKKNMEYKAVTRGHIYRCARVDSKTHKRLCTMCQIHAECIEPAVFLALWSHLTQPDLLLANARAYYDSLPSRPAAASLEAELIEVRQRIKRMAKMVHLGTYDEDEGNAMILADQKREAEILAELRTAGSVIDLPARQVVESACRRIAEGRMPSTFDVQRPVLERLVAFKVYWDGEYATITGKVPIPAALAYQGRKSHGRVHGGDTSTLFIPFKIKERVA